MNAPRIQPDPDCAGQKSGLAVPPHSARGADVPAFDAIPVFFSVRGRAGHGLPQNTNAAPPVPFLSPFLIELVAAAVAGAAFGAAFVLILTWEVVR